MTYKILKNPVGIVEFTLKTGEKIIAEAGALVYIRGEISTKTRMRKKGFFKSLKVAFLGGESFFVNEFTAEEDNSKLALTGNMVGDIESIPIKEQFIIQSGAFISSTEGLTLDTQWQGFVKGLFGTNLFMLKTIGEGTVFVNGYGGIIRKTLKNGEKMLVDNYQLVAFSSKISYRITKHGSLKSTLLGGEALLIELIGPGEVYIQTKSIMEFARALTPYLPKESKKTNAADSALSSFF